MQQGFEFTGPVQVRQAHDDDDGGGAGSVRETLAAAVAAPETLTAAALVSGIVGCSVEDAGAALEKLGGPRGLVSAAPSALVPAFPGATKWRIGLLRAVGELARRAGVQPLQRGEAIRGAADVCRAYGPILRDLKMEQFRVILLDGKHRVIREVLVSQGTLTSSPVHPREVFAPAIAHSAAAMVLLHNHPSGDPAPSADDLEITRRLADVGALVGIRIVDHVIIGDGAFVSFADRGLL